MKKTVLTLAVCLACMTVFFASCKKNTVAPASSCMLIFNDTISRTADSIHWDYYTSVPHMQAFIGGVAVVTVYPSTFSTHTETLGRQYLYWIVQYPAIYTVDASGGTLTLTNTSGELSGTFSASGTVWSGGNASTPPTSKVTATFSHVKQLGL